MLLMQAQQMVDFENRQGEQRAQITAIEQDKQKVEVELNTMLKRRSLDAFCGFSKSYGSISEKLCNL
ncbi:hypothetical protein M23134_07333 [Microscilla marina ATCC 23134]|uniref:Uncharacterized protein n=2 Tax=Microscilla marina TaxID=1027 RepID=A1ZVI4_MICM2|nr:hypothetical protein M23134_07333 [Microscilla marina ATCC 23134]